ncbi:MULTISPECIES: serine hydrolase domain-containing protein [unclassified Streptomyces]|uniref:serine hydrolase domain-containing protein n=1 Tax=unclassified Streptomyces TaxID=2593676 RepID=UPI00381BB983
MNRVVATALDLPFPSPGGSVELFLDLYAGTQPAIPARAFMLAPNGARPHPPAGIDPLHASGKCLDGHAFSRYVTNLRHAMTAAIDPHQISVLHLHHLAFGATPALLRALPAHPRIAFVHGTDPQDIRDGVLHEALHRPPGEAVEYTDRAALVLGYLAEHLSGQPLDQLATDRIWNPLGMTQTRFGPLPDAEAARCAPTEYNETTGTHLKGTAHDFSARLLDGVCGIAGTFSVLDDLARFLRHMLAPTQAAFGPAWIKGSLRVQTGGLTPARGLFWHPAPGTDPTGDIWVHYGFTGTGMWISPTQDRWASSRTNSATTATASPSRSSGTSFG